MNESFLVQYEEQPVYDPYLSPYVRGNKDLEGEYIASFFLGCLVLIVWWGLTSWKLPTKAGYTGFSRWVWTAFLIFPVTTVWVYFAFLLVPPPWKREQEKLKAELEEAKREQDKLRQQTERNLDYIRKVNLEVERLRHEALMGRSGR